MKNKAKQKGALFSSLSTLSLRFSSPKSAGMPKQQGSKTSARLGADAKEQAGTANCLQTAQQKLTQLPDEAGTTQGDGKRTAANTRNTPPPRSTKRSTTCRCWSPAHKRRKAPADEHTGSKNRRARTVPTSNGLCAWPLTKTFRDEVDARYTRLLRYCTTLSPHRRRLREFAVFERRHHEASFVAHWPCCQRALSRIQPSITLLFAFSFLNQPASRKKEVDSLLQ